MAGMTRPKTVTFAEFTGATEIARKYARQADARQLIDSTTEKLGPGKITFAGAIGLESTLGLPSLAANRPKQMTAPSKPNNPSRTSNGVAIKLSARLKELARALDDGELDQCQELSDVLAEVESLFDFDS